VIIWSYWEHIHLILLTVLVFWSVRFLSIIPVSVLHVRLLINWLLFCIVIWCFLLCVCVYFCWHGEINVFIIHLTTSHQSQNDSLLIAWKNAGYKRGQPLYQVQCCTASWKQWALETFLLCGVKLARCWVASRNKVDGVYPFLALSCVANNVHQNTKWQL